MKLRLKQSVVADKLYVPPAVIDAEALGLSEDEAQGLIDRGVAELAGDEPAPAEVEQEPETEPAAAEAEPEVIDAAPAEAEPAPAPRTTTRTRK